MSEPRIHGNRRAVSASAIREALAEALMMIKTEDRLTFADVGRVLGKSEDQAARYCDATASMSAESLYFGKETWGSRFTGLADCLVEDAHRESGQTAQTLILKAALALSTALEDGRLNDSDLIANRSTLENARDAIDRVLCRLKPHLSAGGAR